MANIRRETVGYQKFRTQALLSDGLLGVAREGGDLERKVAQGMFTVAGIAGNRADQEAERAGEKAGQADALAGAPGEATITGSAGSGYSTGLPGAPASTERSTNVSDKGLFDEFMNTVKGGGLTNPYALAAVAATGKSESGFSSKNVFGSWSDPSESGAAGTAGGALSWRAERLAKLRAFGKSGNQNPDIVTQAKFFLQEDPKLIERLNAARSPEEAQRLMNNAWQFAGYDRPGGEAARRINLANTFVSQFAGSETDPVQTASVAAPSADTGSPPLMMVGENIKGLVAPGNIDLAARPVVKNSDGTISTVRSMSFEDKDGKETLIPTVSPDGKILSNDDAIKLYRETGQHLGKFDSPDDATAYAKSLHTQQEKMYAKNAPVPSAASVAAPGVVETVEPVEIKPGKRGTFKPTDRNTVFGRAYDATGTRTYLQMLDSTMRTEISNVYEAAKNDPVELKKKLDALKVMHLDAQEGHVFDEIRPEYEVAFSRLTAPLLQQANRDASQRVELQNKADFLSRTTELETDIQRRTAAITPDNPMAAGDLTSAQDALDDHYDSAVAHGILDPVSAQKAKETSRRNTALSFYERQAENLPADKIATLREAMRSDFAAGELDGVDGDGWALLDTKLNALERSKRVEDRQAEGELTKRGNQFAARLASGFEVDPAELSKFMLDGNTAPGGAQIVNETLTKIDLARGLKDMTVDEGEKRVQDLQAKLGDNPSDEAVRVYGYAREILDTKKKLIDADPVVYVQNTDPKVRAAWEAVSAGGDPQAFSNALDITARAQEKLGIKSPKLLPKSVATTAVTQFKDATLPEDKRISAVTNIMFATSDSEQRKQIFDQLVTGGLDGFSEGAFDALDRGEPEAARRLFQAVMLDPTALPGKLPATPAKIDEAIQDRIMGTGSIGDVYYGLTGGAADNYLSAERDSKLITRAVQLRLKNGEDLNTAVDGVSRDLFGDVVAVSGNRNVNAQLLLPRDQDAKVVLDGLATLKPQVGEALKSSMAVPADMKISAGGRVLHDRVTANRREDILDQGFFRSAGDDFVFINPFTGSAIGGADGKPLTFKLDAVVNAGAKSRSEKAKEQTPQDLERQLLEDRAASFGTMGGARR